jgi:hypothetical protein
LLHENNNGGGYQSSANSASRGWGNYRGCGTTMVLAVVAGSTMVVAMEGRSSSNVKGATTKPCAKSVSRVTTKLLTAGITMMSPFRVKTTMW